MAKEEIIKSAVGAVSQARQLCDDVEFSPEDASRTELAYLADVVTAAIEAGATTVNIPDTVGYTVPAEFDRLFRYLKDNVPGIEDITLSVHCHDDLGMAVANSLAAVIAGARQVECTINGIGERARSTALVNAPETVRLRKL
jgi:2-isopropylmalate synthase